MKFKTLSYVIFVKSLVIILFHFETHAATVKSLPTTIKVTPPVTGAQDFATRCAQPGVIRCHGFEAGTRFNLNDSSARTYDYDYMRNGFTSYKPEDIRMSISTDQKTSGNSSLKAFVPAVAGSDGSGAFVVRFSDDGKTQLGLNEEFYVQWRQRFTKEMIHPYKSDRYSEGTAWKQTIIGSGDIYDSSGKLVQPTYSCTILEMVSNAAAITLKSGGPATLRYGFYHSCGFYSGMDFWYNPVNQVILQHQGPPYCVYPNDPQNGCMLYYPDEWMTFQVHIKIGSRWANSPTDLVSDSNVEVWVGREGKASVKIYDANFMNNNKGYGITNNKDTGGVYLKYGKVWLTPYMSYRDSTVTYEDAYTWYDDLIISRNKIAEPK